MEYRNVDVFADRAYSGNGLVVFFGGIERAREELQAITTEMRQFESIFLSDHEAEGRVSARVFTVEEELDFAGHPIIGATAVAHERWSGEEKRGAGSSSWEGARSKSRAAGKATSTARW